MQSKFFLLTKWKIAHDHHANMLEKVNVAVLRVLNFIAINQKYHRV